MTWLNYHARHMGMSYAEYHLMTSGEIEDMALCGAIQSGSMEELPVIEGSSLSDLAQRFT